MNYRPEPPKHHCTDYARMEYGPDYVRCGRCGYAWRWTGAGWWPYRYGRVAG